MYTFKILRGITMRKTCSCLILALVIFAEFHLPLWAVGGASFGNQVVGSRGFGMGNAFTGVANDPSAIYYNPAGITQLNQIEISYGLTIEPLSSEYTAKNSNQLTGGSPNGTRSNINDIPVVPHLYAVIPLSEKNWSVGFGVNSPFGLETHWSHTGPLRYAATDSKISFVNFNPTLAYKFSDKVSFGGGIVYGLNSNSMLKKKINNNVLNYNLSNGADPSQLSAGYFDGDQKLSGDGDGWGYNIGTLWKPIEKHSLGISYRSEIKIKVKGKIELTNLTGAYAPTAFGGTSYTANAETDLIQPQSLIIGYGFTPGNWTFAFDGEWINFSAVDNTTLRFSGSNSTADSVINSPSSSVINRDWHNTWNIGMGGNYKFNDHWEARCGYYHHDAVIPSATWDPSIPDSSKNGYTLGGSFNLPSFSIDLVYNYLVFHERNITNSNNATLSGTANGKYKTKANIFGITFNHRFGGIN